jgi:uncharacterized membrane protein
MPRVLALAAFVVAANAIGNYAVNWGMKHGGIFTAWTLGGIAVLIVWTVSRIKLLEWADLSYVLPVTSIGYIIPLILGVTLLGETVSVHRWAGALLIATGAALVSPTKARTS